jgi:hypothetical protein
MKPRATGIHTLTSVSESPTYGFALGTRSVPDISNGAVLLQTTPIIFEEVIR